MVVDRVAAVVNDEVITLSEIYEIGGLYITEQLAIQGEGKRTAIEHEVLERLIEQALINQTITSLDLEVTPQELDRSIDDIAQRNGLDRDQLRAEVERAGMAWDEYRDALGDDLRELKFTQTVIRPRINITEDELRDAYLRIDQPTAAVVQAIFLSFPLGADEAARQAVVARAEELRQQALGGADFAELSKQHDQGPYGANGGEMGRFRKGELMPALDNAVYSTAPGSVSAPVVIAQGVLLLKVVRTEAAGGDFESMRGQIMEKIFSERIVEEQERWFQQARRQASVRILLPK